MGKALNPAKRRLGRLRPLTALALWAAAVAMLAANPLAPQNMTRAASGADHLMAPAPAQHGAQKPGAAQNCHDQAPAAPSHAGPSDEKDPDHRADCVDSGLAGCVTCKALSRDRDIILSPSRGLAQDRRQARFHGRVFGPEPDPPKASMS